MMEQEEQQPFQNLFGLSCTVSCHEIEQCHWKREMQEVLINKQVIRSFIVLEEHLPMIKKNNPHACPRVGQLYNFAIPLDVDEIVEFRDITQTYLLRSNANEKITWMDVALQKDEKHYFEKLFYEITDRVKLIRS